jgi:rhodanese-related sulfurtransferase
MINNGIFPNLVVLDVRTQDEYNKGHLDNAVLIPLEELESRITELSQYKNTKIVVYCRIGNRSPEASSILSSQKFTKVLNVLNGITDWESANYPIIVEPK